MNRCVGCGHLDRAGEVLLGDFWCHPCVVEGHFHAFVEAQALVDSIVAERARRIPTPRDDKRFKRNDEKV